MRPGRLNKQDIRELVEIPDELLDECWRIDPLSVVQKSPEKLTKEQIRQILRPQTWLHYKEDNADQASITDARSCLIQYHADKLDADQAEQAIMVQTTNALRYCLHRLPLSRRRKYARRNMEQCMFILGRDDDTGTLPKALMEIWEHLRPPLKKALTESIAHRV